MFEHLSIMPRRYGEDAVRRNNRLRGLEFIGTPEFERLFDELCILRDRFHPTSTPKVSIQIDDDDEEDIEINRQMKDNFKWKIEDDNDVDDNDVEDDELDEGDAYDEDPVKEPPSIFDMLKSGKEFKDIVSPNSKHTEIYNQAFGLDDNSQEEDMQDEEDDDEVKDLSVFIANRLTFLIQTIQPVIFDTSSIEVKDNTMTVAINEEKTFPKIGSIDELGFITCKVNCSQTIQRAIDDFLGDDCFYSSIYCFPTKTVDRHGKDVFAIKFVCYRK